MDDLTPEQIAALREYREKRIAESRARYGKLFTRTDIVALIEKVERSKAATSSKPSFSFFESLLRWPLPRGLQTAFAVCLLAALILWFFRKSPDPVYPLTLAALSSPERATAFRPFGNLKLDLQHSRIEVFDGTDHLPGRIKPLKDVSQGVSSFTVALEGKDSMGAEGWFSGTLYLTNTPGSEVIRNSSDVAGAFLTGSFGVVGRATNTVQQAYGHK